MTVASFDNYDPDEVDPALVDLDAQELIDGALALIGDRFPEWVPREGNTEVVLIEALAREAAEMVYAIRQVAPDLRELLLQRFGLTRGPGSPPFATVRFAVAASTVARTIPAGTALVLGDGDDDADPVVLVTDNDLLLPAGATAGTVTATAPDATTAANGAAAGARLELVDSLGYVDTVTLDGALVDGTPPEDSAEFLARGSAVLTRLSTTLVLPAHIEAYLHELGVPIARVLDLYDPATPGLPPGTKAGHVTAAVASAAGGRYTADQLDALAAQIRARMHAGLKIHVVGADTTTVNVSVTVVRRATETAADVAAAVEARIRDYLSPDGWQWARTVRLNEVIAAADTAAGVDTVLSAAVGAGGGGVATAADLVLPGVAPLVRAGTITVSVSSG